MGNNIRLATNGKGIMNEKKIDEKKIKPDS